MFNRNQPEPTRHQVLVVGSDDLPFVEAASQIENLDPSLEVLTVEGFAEAASRIARSEVAVVLFSGTQPGALEIGVECANQANPPRAIVFHDRAAESSEAAVSQFRAAPSSITPASLARLVRVCAEEFAVNLPAPTSILVSLCAAMANCPDSAWLRITEGSGESGDFCVREGKVVYCESAHLVGEPAAARVLSWASCKLELRILPDFLRDNMNVRLDKLRSIAALGGGIAEPDRPDPAPSAATVAPTTAEAAAPSPVSRTESEEPEEFPLLESLPPDAPQRVSGPEKARADLDLALEEPEDAPEFEPGAGDIDIFVEEPSELFMVPDGEMHVPVPDHPLSSDPQSRPPFSGDHPAGLFSEVFAALAVVGDFRVESCNPPEQALYFDPIALRKIYTQSAEYTSHHGLGRFGHALISGEDAAVLVGPIPGGDTLLAARTKAADCGSAEATEFRRLQQALSTTCSFTLRR